MDKAQKKAALNNINMRNPWHFLALGFGTGLAPFMPGTFGTLAALPLLLVFPYLSVILQLLLTLFVCVVGVYLCDRTARDMGVHDHPAIVWDEVAGMAITMLAVPITASNLLLGFLLFRFFDIVKPWPISYFDKQVHGGLGIMLDDIVAGVLSLAALQAILYYDLLKVFSFA